MMSRAQQSSRPDGRAPAELVKANFMFLILWALPLAAWADFQPALARVVLDRDRVQPGGTVQATYVFRSDGPASEDLKVFTDRHRGERVYLAGEFEVTAPGIPASLYCGTPMKAEPESMRDPVKLMGLKEQFCERVAPWYYENNTTAAKGSQKDGAPPPVAPAAVKPAAAVADAGPQEAPRQAPDFKLTHAKPEPGRTTRILIVTGQEHGAHNWRQTAPLLAEELSKDPRLLVDVSENAAILGSPEIAGYVAIVLNFMNPEPFDLGAKGRENLRAYVEGGKGLMLVHFACGAFQEWPEFRGLVARVWDPKLRGHDPRGPFRVEITDVKHPITEGLKAFDAADELYTCLAGDKPIEVLAKATSKVDGKDYPMAFVAAAGKGRIFQCLLGHDVKAMRMPGVGELYRRGCAWVAGLPPVAK